MHLLAPKQILHCRSEFEMKMQLSNDIINGSLMKTNDRDGAFGASCLINEQHTKAAKLGLWTPRWTGSANGEETGSQTQFSMIDGVHRAVWTIEIAKLQIRRIFPHVLSLLMVFSTVRDQIELNSFYRCYSFHRQQKLFISIFAVNVL